MVGDGPPPGTTDSWVQLTLPNYGAGDVCQSVVDLVVHGTLYTACGNNDGRKIKWYKSVDYGDTWTITNSTTMGGNPWACTIDPNPNRDPNTPATIYSPAGYGSLGAWKSTDGAGSWTRLAGADAALARTTRMARRAPISTTRPFCRTIRPMTCSLRTTTVSRTPDGGVFPAALAKTGTVEPRRVVHPPADGMGTSHYVLPISATTWCVISQEADSGMWRTTTAGRVGGTAGAKYRDGTISTAAWTRVIQHAHIHGSYTPVKVGTTWYSPGLNAAEGSIWKSTDDGATWPDLIAGVLLAYPPNAAFMNKNVTTLAATAKYIYSSANVEIARAPIANDTDWHRNYTTTPAGLQLFGRCHAARRKCHAPCSVGQVDGVPLHLQRRRLAVHRALALLLERQLGHAVLEVDAQEHRFLFERGQIDRRLRELVADLLELLLEVSHERRPSSPCASVSTWACSSSMRVRYACICSRVVKMRCSMLPISLLHLDELFDRRP